MIPSDVASRLQVTADAALRPVANIQEITDKLAGLAPGQRLMADIQALLPNGTYRAVINQRDVTLALPFAAKAGDSLELEVVSNDGKLTLAVLSRPPGEGGKAPTESVPTTLSRTGQLIGSLFGHAGNAKSGPAPTALNGNQPLASAPPANAQDILPQLKQAIAQSGMFYESHQAEWVNGRFDKNALLQEPQGRLPPRFAPTATAFSLSAQNLAAALTPQLGGSGLVDRNALLQAAQGGPASYFAPTATASGLLAQNPAAALTPQGQMAAAAYQSGDPVGVSGSFDRNALLQEPPSGLAPRLTPTATASGLLAQNPAAALTPQGQMLAAAYRSGEQAVGIGGQFDRNALLQEAQGEPAPRLTPTATAPGVLAQNPAAASMPLGVLGEQATAAPPSGEATLPQPATHSTASANERFDATSRAVDTPPSPVREGDGRPDKTAAGTSQATQSAPASPSPPPSQLVAAPALPLVQQQLEALATQNFVWQGQVWPGQTMRWEIEEEARHRETESDDGSEPASRWQTRLHLTLPRLGEVDAQIKLQGQEITLALTSASAETQSLLRSAAEALRSQLGEAGLALSSLGVGNAKDNS